MKNKLVNRAIVPVLLLSTCAFAENIDRGHEIYAQICVTCHGPNLDGGIGPSLVDSYWKHGDTPEAIMRSITKGITGTEMIAYEYVYSKEDRQAVTDFILDKQQGNRQTLRSLYSRDYFKGKRLSPELFDSVESDSQGILPENFLYTKACLRWSSSWTIQVVYQRTGQVPL